MDKSSLLSPRVMQFALLGFGCIVAVLLFTRLSSHGTALEDHFADDTRRNAATQAALRASVAALVPADAQERWAAASQGISTTLNTAAQQAQNLSEQVNSVISATPQAVPVLTPVAEYGTLRVQVEQVERSAGMLHISGEIANTGSEPLDVPISAFKLRDSAGTEYGLPGDHITHLEGGEHAPLNILLPLAADRGIALVVTLPPNASIEQMLSLPIQP